MRKTDNAAVIVTAAMEVQKAFVGMGIELREAVKNPDETQINAIYDRAQAGIRSAIIPLATMMKVRPARLNRARLDVMTAGDLLTRFINECRKHDEDSSFVIDGTLPDQAAEKLKQARLRASR